jgi:hypothetical protein
VQGQDGVAAIQARRDGAALDRVWPDLAEVAEPATHLGSDGLAGYRAPFADALPSRRSRDPRAGAVMPPIARETGAEEAHGVRPRSRT